jgi:hypothetical protein
MIADGFVNVCVEGNCALGRNGELEQVKQAEDGCPRLKMYVRRLETPTTSLLWQQQGFLLWKGNGMFIQPDNRDATVREL